MAYVNGGARPMGAYFSQQGSPIYSGAGAYFSQQGSPIYSGAGAMEEASTEAKISALAFLGLAGFFGWAIFSSK